MSINVDKFFDDLNRMCFGDNIEVKSENPLAAVMDNEIKAAAHRLADPEPLLSASSATEVEETRRHLGEFVQPKIRLVGREMSEEEIDASYPDELVIQFMPDGNTRGRMNGEWIMITENRYGPTQQTCESSIQNGTRLPIRLEEQKPYIQSDGESPTVRRLRIRK